MSPALRRTLIASTSAVVLGTAALVIHAGPSPGPAIVREALASTESPSAQMTVVESQGGYAVEALPPLVAGTVGQPLVLRPRQILEGTPPFRRQVDGPGDAALTPNGSISILPTKPGLSGPYTLTITDARDRTVTTQTYVEVSPPLRLEGGVARSAILGKRFSSTLSPAGGRPPYAWSFSGNLPPGLSFLNGEISGTPTVSGRFEGMVVTVLDADNRQSFSGAISIDVGGVLSIATLPASVDAVVGRTLVLPPVEIKGGTGPFRRALLGPEGASLRGDGSLEVLARKAGSLGPFEISVVDAHGQSATARLMVNAVQPIEIAAAEAPILVAGVESSMQAPTVTGGVGPFTFVLTGSEAPPGMTLLQATGALVGTPSRPGLHGPYRIEVRDSSGHATLSPQFDVPVFPARDEAFSQKEILVDGSRCATSGGWECLSAAGARTIEFRFPAPRRVSQAEFGCDYLSAPTGVWSYWNGRQWLPVDLASESACSARFRTVGTTAVRFAVSGAPIRRVWTARSAP